MQLKHWRDYSVKVKLGMVLAVVLVCLWTILVISLVYLNHISRNAGKIINSNLSISRYMNSFIAENVMTEENNRLAVTPSMVEAYYKGIAETDQRWRDVLEADRSNDTHTQALRHAISQAMEYYRKTQLGFIRATDLNEKAEWYVSLKKQAGYIERYNVILLETSMRQADEEWSVQSDKQLQNSRYIVAFSIVITLFLSVSLQFFVRNLVRNVGQLGEAADRIRRGQYDMPSLPVRSQDELGRTATSFNLMLEKIKQHIHALEQQSAMEKALLEKEVENMTMQKELETSRFAQLQSQINPHFLFNTLNTIASLADEEEARYTEELIQRLAKFFRYSLEQENLYVSLEQELRFAQDYMELQEARFAGQYAFEVMIDPEVDLSTSIPKFLIQPVLENAILHGVRKRQSGGEILLKISRSDHFIEVLVTDNGAGFPVGPELKKQASTRGDQRVQFDSNYVPGPVVLGRDWSCSPDQLQNSEKRKGDGQERPAVGLKNIQRRLDLFGGKLYIESEVNKGTSVYLLIPEE